MNGSAGPLSLWFIFQGDLAKDHVERMRRTMGKLDHIDFRISSDGPSTHLPSAGSSNTVLEGVLSDCRSAAGAVAVIADAGQDASRRGNLWLEIGFWVASRAHHLLKLCCHRDITPISNLLGFPYARYDSVEDLAALVSAHATHVQAYHATTHAPTECPGLGKVYATFDTFGHSRGWLDVASYGCHRDLGLPACPFRLSGLEFVAELLRMGRANHERNAIGDCLTRIAICCQRLDRLESGWSHRDLRERLCSDLLQHHRRLVETVQWLLGEGGRQETYREDPRSVEERFELFLCERLDVAERLSLRPVGLEVGAVALRAYSRELLTKVAALAKGDPGFEKDGREGNPTFANSLHECGRYCREIAAVLQEVSRRYYDDCRLVLKRHLGSPPNLFVYEALARAIRELPHNLPSTNHMRIWNRAHDHGTPGVTTR